MAQGWCPNRFLGFTPVRFPGSPPLAKPLSETQMCIEGLLVPQHVIARARQLVRQRLGCQCAVRPALFAIVKASGLRRVTDGEVGRFHKRPGEIFVAVPGVAFTLFLAVTFPSAIHAPAVGTEVADLGKAAD